jgi:hypothetical protein
MKRLLESWVTIIFAVGVINNHPVNFDEIVNFYSEMIVGGSLRLVQVDELKLVV